MSQAPSVLVVTLLVVLWYSRVLPAVRALGPPRGQHDTKCH